DQVGNELQQRSNSVLKQTLSDLNDTVSLLTNDASVAQQTLLFVLVVAAVVSILASVLLTIGLTNPLRQLSRVAQAIANGDLAMRARTTRHDEIGQLATAFDQMTDSLQRSLETERAASEQIRLQTMQIARQTQASAVIDERQRIARELHDSVKQQLFSITLSAGAALNLLASDPSAAREYLEHLKRASREAQIEMKNLLQELVPAPLQERRLDEALDQYLHNLCKVHQLQLIWNASGENSLPITHEHALFRASQEAIANVIRHSGACKLNVSLNFGLQTTLTVEDDGCGFDPESISPGSTGLSTMRSRLERVGGTLLIDATPGHGTRVQMIVYHQPEARAS
ncbi:MAG TPA: histidine kinase, partial [Aggregatilineales bacterium]|nr:histidine kinase [Aggregatilineales bacterium]